MINKIDTTQLSEITASAASKQQRAAGPEPGQSQDACLQAEFAPLIKRACADSESDPIRIQQAKELLDKGLLDTPDNSRLAARNIVRFGI